jgi:hypothetical protein
MSASQRIFTATLLFSSALGQCALPRMGGVTLPDGFGTALPAGLTAKAVAQ